MKKDNLEKMTPPLMPDVIIIDITIDKNVKLSGEILRRRGGPAISIITQKLSDLLPENALESPLVSE